MATTLNRIMKKAASSVIPLASRIPPRRNYTSAVFTARPKTSSTTIRSVSTSSTGNLSSYISRATSTPTHHGMSAQAQTQSNSDDPFLSVVESEIECAEEKIHELGEVPKEFPFKIDYNAGDKRTITLRREYQGEEIIITVGKYYHGYPESSEGDAYVLVGNVSKKSGQNLKFNVIFDVEDGIRISSLDVKNNPDASDSDAIFGWSYARPDFWNLDENFHKAFRTYLEVRGIEPSITKFLPDCMLKNTQKKYTTWLKNLKDFIKAN